MENVTIIIPVVKYDEKDLCETLKSIDTAEWEGKHKVILSSCGGYDELSAKYGSKKGYSVVKADEDNMWVLINAAALKCTTEYFSVAEQGDVMLRNWPKAYGKGVQDRPFSSVIMNICEVSEIAERGKCIGTLNELLWNEGFIEDGSEMGILTKDELDAYQGFMFTGSLIKTGDFIASGMLKKSLKLFAWTELIYRLIHGSKHITCIPRTCYCHRLGKSTEEKVSPEETEWLSELSKQEYFYKEDRGKTFDER